MIVQEQEEPVPVELLDPDDLPRTGLYSQVSVATGRRTVHVAGQVSVDADGTVVAAGDLAGQVERCYRNVGAALAAAGASFDDVVKLTAYFVDWAPEKTAALADGIARGSAALGTARTPPFTGLGVQALAAPEYLVEVEAVAVLD